MLSHALAGHTRVLNKTLTTESPTLLEQKQLSQESLVEFNIVSQTILSNPGVDLNIFIISKKSLFLHMSINFTSPNVSVLQKNYVLIWETVS